MTLTIKKTTRKTTKKAKETKPIVAMLSDKFPLPGRAENQDFFDAYQQKIAEQLVNQGLVVYDGAQLNPGGALFCHQNTAPAAVMMDHISRQQAVRIRIQ